MTAYQDPFEQGDTFDPETVVWINHLSDLRLLSAGIKAASEIVIDLETTGLDEHATGRSRDWPCAARVSFASLTLPTEANPADPRPPTFAVPLSHPDSPLLGVWREVLHAIAIMLRDSGLPITNQNLGFDMAWIFATAGGVDLTEQFSWDTMIGSHLLDETIKTKLKVRAPVVFGIPPWDDHDLSTPGASERVPLYELGLYACIAEGQPVLTDRGPVPIERVTRVDRLWDGVEWVWHGGVIFKGTQAVVELDNGLTATPDHLILTTQGDYSCMEGVRAGARRAAAATDEAALGGLLDPDRPDVAGAPSSDRRSELLSLRCDLREAGERFAARSERLPVSVVGEVGPRPSGTSPKGPLPRDGAEVLYRRGHEPEPRRPGHPAEVHLGRGVHPVGDGGPASRDLRGCPVRPDRQRGALRAGQPPALNASRELDEPTRHRACAVHGSAGCPAPSLGLGQDRSTGLPARSGRTDPPLAAGSDSRAGSERSLPRARVYDILNAGPRHRFVVSGIVVSNCRDTYWTWRLARYQRTLLAVGREGEDADEPESAEEVEDRRLGRLAVWVAMPTSAALTTMHQNGFPLDVEWAEAKRTELLASAAEPYSRMVDRYPLETEEAPSFAPTSRWFADWSMAAVQAHDLQIGALTPSGKPQWSKAVLVRQERAGSEVAADLLAYRRDTKRVEFLNSWLDKATPEGKVYAMYNAGRTVTGRLSSSDPNMQQVTSEIKPAYWGGPGYYVADLDYSQIEMRLAAHVADCEPMIEAFLRGDDLHRMLAAVATGKPLGEITKDDRQGGKAGNFGFLFGMEAQGFQTYAETVYGVSFTPDEAYAVREAFFDQWDGMAQWHSRTVARAKATGQIVSPIGRVRRLPEIHFEGYPGQHAERQSINSPVQGFASDIMQTANASISGHLPGVAAVPGVRTLATVHDSLVVAVPIEGWQRSVGLCMRRMLDVAPVLKRLGCELRVPLAVKAEVGTRWGLTDVGVIE